MYSRMDSVNWKLDSTTATTYAAASLVPGTPYQWKVWSKCSADSSNFVNTSFVTESSVACASTPTGLLNGTGTDTTKRLSWSSAAGAARYDLQFRRQGATAWRSALVSLLAGTTYEWRVRTVCIAGSGAFANGASFTTSGTTICYAPTLLSVDSVSAIGVSFKWNGSATASYKLRYRIMETISWTNAITPMTSVSTDTLQIPKTTGAYMHTFSGGSAFTYDGGGLYIAFEYSRSKGSLSTFNTAFANVEKNTIKSTAALVDTSATAQSSILDVTVFRPETLLGSAAMKDSVAVSAIYALGHYAQGYSDGSSISARIVNASQTSRTLAVTLTVKDTANTIKHTNTQNITVAAGASGIQSFSGWNPTVLSTDSLIVSIPVQTGEMVSGNNRNYYVQKVNPSIAGYDDLTQNISGAGFGGGAGLLLTKYRMNGCGTVMGTRIYLAPGAKGKTLYAVVMDTAGTILSQSESFTADSTAINNYHHFYFSTPRSFTNVDYFVGLAQASSGTYFPVGLQWETENVRTGAYYKAPIAGGKPTDTSFGGRLMINAEVIAGRSVAEINGNTILCPNGSTTLQAGSINARFANRVLQYSSQNGNVQYSADMTLGAPDVYPLHGPYTASWVSRTADGQREFLELQFAGAAKINFIDIYETFNPGAIDTVFVKNASNQFVQVYSRTASSTPGNVSNKKRITFPLTTFPVSEIRIALASNITTGYNAIDAVAIGTVASPDTVGTFSWTGGSTANAITVSTPGKYTLTINDTSGCSSSNSVQVTSRTAVIPTISFQNLAPAKDTSICFGDSLVLKASPGTGLTWSTGGTKDTIIVRHAGTYTVSYNDGTGCGSTVSAPIVVGINALPTVSITGSLGICPGGTTILDAGAGYSAYAWSTGASTRTITVYTPGVYKVTVKNSSGCAASSSVTTFAATNPVPTISGALQFCSGSSTTLSAVGTGYTQYTWSTGATTQSITVSTAGTYSVTVKNGNGCSGTASAQVTYFAPPVPTITGAKAICANGSTTLSTSAVYNSYSWSNGATTRSITASSTGDYTVTVTDNNGCTGATTVTVTQLPSPSPTITGGLTFCGGSSGTLDAGPGYTSYLWSTGAATQTLAVTTTGSYSVSVTDGQGCGGSSSVTITQEGSVPQTPGVISGAVIGLCNTAGNVYSIAPVSGASYYVWTVPDGATITAGDGTTSITVSYGSTITSGSIEVAAANACGQSSSVNPRRLTVQGAPATPGSITGMVTGVCGQTSTYSISAVTGASTYTWTVPTGASIVSGQGTAAIQVNFTSSFTSGSICVKANNSCGSSAIKCLTVSGKPTMNGGIFGPTTVCSRQADVTSSIPAATGATSYTWTVPS
ncbi:MAG: hypothetical protein WKF70_09720, partial [Chitinophagaceae bacterium]